MPKMMNKEEENHNDHVKNNGDHNKNEKLVTGTDHEPKQTLQSKNIEVECANMEAATESEIHLEGAKKLVSFFRFTTKIFGQKKGEGKEKI